MRPGAMLGGALTAAAGAAGMAWAVRGRASQVFAPSIWRLPVSRGRTIALTFDDGPSESTSAVLELLHRFDARATFFQCGANAERLPHLARAVSEAGHEIGNHTYSHPALWLRSPGFIADEVGRAQQTLTAIHGAAPRWFRAPYGVRWPGLAAAQERHGLLGAMWTAIGRDWADSGESVAARLLRAAQPGAILCLHDGRVLTNAPRIDATLAALERILPVLRDQGFQLSALGPDV